MKTDSFKSFDLDMAKAGVTLVTERDEIDYMYADGPDSHGNVVCKNVDGNFVLLHQSWLYMLPLTMLEKKPVYAGDTLYDKDFGTPFQVISAGILKHDIIPTVFFTNGKSYKAYLLTWNKPKVKKSGWVNVYPSYQFGAMGIHATKEAADEKANLTIRTGCVQVFWEE